MSNKSINITSKKPSVEKTTKFKFTADTVLNLSAGFWFLIAVIGQLIFVYYIISFYGNSAIKGDLSVWEKVLPHGIISGDPMGNFALSLHLLLAVIITVGGPLQLIAQIRSRFPIFHHWTGRIYICTVIATSIFGFYLVWGRGTVGGVVQHLGITLDGILIIVFALLTIRYAMKRKISVHRRWALRLFMVVSAVWFFRVGLMFWLLVTGGAGINMDTFRGPFLDFLSFADYLIPLIGLEIYLRGKKHGSELLKFIIALGLFIATIAMAAGISVATIGMWAPHM